MPDSPEVEELLRAAEWRQRQHDSDPADEPSAAAAVLLERLAEDLRHLQSSPTWRELGAVCNWLSESDEIIDFEQRAHEYRKRIGIEHYPADGEAYLQALLVLAKASIGGS